MRLTFKDIKKGDRFTGNNSGFTWTVEKRSTKRKKITMWSFAGAESGPVSIEFSIGEMNRLFERQKENGE